MVFSLQASFKALESSRWMMRVCNDDTLFGNKLERSVIFSWMIWTGDIYSAKIDFWEKESRWLLDLEIKINNME